MNKTNILKLNSKNASGDNEFKNLLPSGFHDHIFDEAEKETEINNIILSELKKQNFKLIRPAILEFEESLDGNHSPDFFKVSDPISGKMMVLRSDITQQIARIIRDKFSTKNFQKSALKVSYTGQVFRKNPKVNFTERQLTQTGFEIVDDNNLENDFVTIKTAIEVFEKLKLGKFTINFNLPYLVKFLVKNEKLLEIETAIETKDYDCLRKLEKKIHEICLISDEIIDLKSAEKSLKKIQQLISEKSAKELISKILKIIITISTKFKNLNISFDILEKAGFTYHTGLCYSFISNETYEEIGRGGRYTISSPEKSIDAVGFTFLVNSLCRV